MVIEKKRQKKTSIEKKVSLKKNYGLNYDI